MSDTIYIASTSEDPKLLKDGTPTWGVSIIKSRGEVIAVASEGARYASPSGLRGFAFEPFSCRRVEVRSGASRMTAKVKEQLISAIKRKLIADGLATTNDAAKAA